MFLDKIKDKLQTLTADKAPLQPAVENAPEEEEELQPQPEVIVPADTTTIGKGIVFYGDFSGDDPIVINGSIEGNISTNAKLTISEEGSYKGNATIENLHTEGIIQGDLVCRQLSTFGPSSTMNGTLKTTFLETARGSIFRGKLTMNTEDAEPVEAPAENPAAEELSGAVSEEQAAQQLQQTVHEDDPYAGLSEEEAQLLREAEADMQQMAQITNVLPAEAPMQELAAEETAEDFAAQDSVGTLPDSDTLKDLAEGIKLPDFLDLKDKPVQKNSRNGKKKK